MNRVFQRRSPGYTLIELMAAMTVSASVFFLTVRLIHQSMRLSSQTQHSQNFVQSFHHFAEDFRRSVQHAITAEEVAAGRWELELESGEKVVFQKDKQTMICQHIRDGKPVRTERLVVRDPLGIQMVEVADPMRLELQLQRTELTGLSDRVLEARATAILEQRCSDSAAAEVTP